MPEKFNAIGKPHWRVDGMGKVTGQARYAADFSVTGMLYGKVLLAKRPSAEIVSIDTADALRRTGVVTILTAKDLGHAKLFGGVIPNQPVLAEDRVRHYGDAVAMVAATSPQAADLALEQIRVEYKELPAVFDPEAALSPESPLVHEPSGQPGQAGSNACVHHRVRKGDSDRAFDRCEVVLEQTYKTQFIEHAYIEPEAVLAELTGEGGIHLTGSFQNLFSSRKAIAAVLGLDLARVTITIPALGGSFGGKDEVMSQMGCRAALLAKATGKAVKMVNSRENSLFESYKRHPYVMHYKVGATSEGKLKALDVRMIADAGPYASMSPFVTWRSVVQSTGPYEYDHVSTDTYAAYTNNCYTGAMRGFGSPQANFAIESIMDELAAELGADPLDLRLQNAFSQGSLTATGQKLDRHIVSIKEVLEKAAKTSDWTSKRAEMIESNKKSTDGKRRGIGLACSYRGVALGAEGADAVGAIVSIQSDGSVILSIGLTEMGQGLGSVMSLIAAEVLGIDTKRIQYFNADTSRTPDSGPTVASRSTTIGGQAVKKAATAAREILFEVAASLLAVKPNQLQARQGRIESTVSGSSQANASVSFDETVAKAYAMGKPLLGFGWHKSPETSWDEESGTGDAYFTYVYGANIAEVEVDIETGKVIVTHVTAVHDVGKAISPAMVKNQIYGGIAMGVGYGTLENYSLNNGVPLAQNFDEYLLTTALDMPSVTPVLIENADPDGPFGAKSIGEPATELAAPAIINAIAFATGKRIRTIPADLETVLLGQPLSRTTRRAGAVAARCRTEKGK